MILNDMSKSNSTWIKCRLCRVRYKQKIVDNTNIAIIKLVEHFKANHTDEVNEFLEKYNKCHLKQILQTQNIE